MNERFSLFDLTDLPFELYLHKHHVFLASSGSENQKADKFFKRLSSENAMDHPP
jgi:hypothetical protein